MSGRLHLLPLLALLAACRGGSSAPDASGGDDVQDDAAPADAPGDVPDAGPDPDAMPPPTGVVQCPSPLPAPTEGSCDVVDGTGTAVIVQGNILGDGFVYLDGSVAYDGDRISCVGCDCAVAAATVITCAGAAVSPGLINAHSHLNYDERYPLASTADGGTRYEHRHDWRLTVSTPSNQHGTGATSVGNRWAELRHLINGTTSLAASTYAGGLVRNLDELETADYDVGFEQITFEVFALNDSSGLGGVPPANCGWNYKYSELQVHLMPGIVTHTSEGIDAYAQQEFLCQSRSLPNGRDFVERNVGHIHGVALTAADYYNMQRDQAALVWAPRSNISLYGNTAQAQVLDRLGGVVALGTDWTYSGSSTLVREMACVEQFDDGWLGNVFTPEDVWRMATINGAIATDNEALIGSLWQDKVADIAVFRAGADQLHQAVIEATTDDVLLVVRDGRVMSGEADVVEALDATCETLDVCGEARRVCGAREMAGTTFAAVATAAAVAPAGYPAILCDTPPMEPTCIPSRPTEYGGVTADDPDGDGVTTGDNCPAMFNPIRPMDGGEQADVDADGTGDACDETPIGTDLDADGTVNATDVCPFVSDDQTDADTDGKGAACDSCESQPNPDHVCFPPLDPIVDVQNGTLPETTDVFIQGVVTSVAYNGMTLQDPSVASGEYAGVFVFTFDPPAVNIGDVVTVAGEIDEYFTLTEIVNATIASVTPGGTVPAPIPLTTTEALDERWEGVLVTLTGISTIEIPYSCSADVSTCTDQRLWELDNNVIAWDAAWGGSDAEWDAEGAGLAAGEPVTGVMTYRFNRRRVTPRIATDIGN